MIEYQFDYYIIFNLQNFNFTIILNNCISYLHLTRIIFIKCNIKDVIFNKKS